MAEPDYLAEYDTPEAWKSRLGDAEEVFRRVKPDVDWLKHALRGIFPRYVEGAKADVDSPHGTVDQVPLNVMQRTAHYIRALCFDQKPYLEYPPTAEGDETLSTMNATLLERVYDQGHAVREWRSALLNMCTTGPAILWQGIGSEISTKERIAAQRVSPDQLVAGVVQGSEMPGFQLPIPSDGQDHLAIAAVARGMVGDPVKGKSLSPVQRDALLTLAHHHDVAFKKELEKHRRLIGRRGDVWYQHTPYGSWCLWDSEVWDRSRLGWMARKLVWTRQQFLDEKSFSDEAKAHVRGMQTSPREVDRTDSKPATTRTSGNEKTVNNQTITFWEIWWKDGLKRHYYLDGCPVFLENDATYPYLGKDGQPIIDGFFPVTVTVPVEHDSEIAERTIGIPPLYFGKPQQIEIIKTRSAYVQAVKKSARVYVAAAGVDEEELEDVRSAKDGTVLHAPAGMRPGEKALDRLPIGEAPKDYLECSQLLVDDFSSMVGIGVPSLTGRADAKTLGQQQMGEQGMGLTQSDLVLQVEGGLAHSFEITRAFVREYFSDAKVAAYLGPKYVTPTVDPQTGEQIPAPFAAWKSSSLDGDALTATIASRRRGDDALRVKQLQDGIVMIQNYTDSTGMPKYDADPQFQMMAKSMELGMLKKYQPSETELMLALAQAQGGVGSDNQNGRDDGRAARGERGSGAVPGRQGRSRDPSKGDQGNTRANRRTTS